MPNINYLQILKDAWGITWKNRFLWWFGFFASLAGGANFNVPSGNNGSKNISTEQFQNFISTHLPLVMAIAAIFVLLIFVFVIIGIIGRGALIKSVEKLIKNEPADFKSGWREGRKYFWKILTLGLLLGFLVLISLLVLAVPVVILFASKAYVAGTLLAILAVIIFIPLIILVSFTKIYGQIYIVAGELKVISAVERAYELFRKNILASIIMGLIFIPVGLAMLFAILAILIPLIVVFGLLGVVLYFIAGKIGAVIIAIIGIFIFLAGVLLLRAVYETFSQTAWLLFFREIATPKVAQEVTAEETERKEKSLAAPDPVHPHTQTE